MQRRLNKHQTIKAFTLIELSVVVSIVAVLLGFTLSIFRSFEKSNNYKTTEDKISVIEAALVKFYKENKRLPCPAGLSISISDSTNRANIAKERIGTTTSCTSTATSTCATDQGVTYIATGTGAYYGALPAETLGLEENYLYDGFGRKFGYEVAQIVTCPDTSSDPNLTRIPDVFYASAAPISITGTNAVSITGTAVYALVSFGENNYGGYDKYGTRKAVSTLANEAENSDADVDFIASEERVSNQKSVAYDDFVRFKNKIQLLIASDIKQPFSFGNPLKSNASLKLWYDASNAKSFPYATYGNIDEALNIAGSNINDLVIGTAPAFHMDIDVESDVYVPGVEFNGTGPYMKVQSTSMNADYTVFIAISGVNNATTTEKTLIAAQITDPSTSDVHYESLRVKSNHLLFRHSSCVIDNSSNDDFALSGNGGTGGVTIIALSKDSLSTSNASATIKMKVNYNDWQTSNQASNCPFTSSTIGTIFLGMSRATGDTLDFDFHELLVFNSVLSEDDANEMIDYLYKKWNYNISRIPTDASVAARFSGSECNCTDTSKISLIGKTLCGRK